MNFGYIKSKVFSPVVLIIILAFAATGAGISYGLLLSFKSRSVIFFEKSISEFRTLQEQVNSVRVFDRYLGDAKIIPGGAELRNNVIRSDDWITPIFRFNKKDAKELSNLKEAPKLSDLIGYEISYAAAEPETAREKVDLLANYVIDASLKIHIDNFVTDTLAAKKLLLTAALLEKDTETYNLSLLENRLNDLKRLAASYPIVAAASERQILSIEKNGERYMPLPMQIIAIERERFDIKEKLAKTQRRVEGLPSEESMLVAHGELTQKINFGKDLAFALIKDIQTRLPTAQKGYELIALLEYQDKYSRMVTDVFSPSRFIVLPTLPVKPVRSPLKITFLFAILGGFIALLWQFRDSIKMVILQSGDKELVLDRLTNPVPVLKAS